MEDDAKVPDDFPFIGVASGIAGLQDKVVMANHKGKFYVPGNTPPERQLEWLACSELLDGYVEKCRKSKSGKRADMTTEEILIGYYRAATKAHQDVDRKQLQWIFEQVAIRLGWEFPELNKLQVRTDPLKVDEAAIQTQKMELSNHQREEHVKSIVEEIIEGSYTRKKR